MIQTLFILAILLQAAAVAYAGWMALTTQRRLAWLLLAISFAGMLLIRLFRAGFLSVESTPETYGDCVRMTIVSTCLLFAMVQIRSICRGSEQIVAKYRESENRYRSVVSAVGEGIIIVDERSVIDCNPAALRILGLSREELVDRARADVLIDPVHPDGSSMPFEGRPSSITLRTGEACRNCVIGIMSKSGKRVWLSSNSEPLTPGQNGKPEVVVVSFMDITDRMQIDQALLTAKNAAEKANAAKDQFLAVLSHELRTPLTPVLATIDTMSVDPALPPEFQKDLELLRRNVELEARLIDDLLDLTRISKGKLQIHIAPVDLHELIRQVLEICASDIRAKNLHIATYFTAEKHIVPGDSARLQQILWNLLKNAIKFTPAGGRITIRSTGKPARACGAMIGIEFTDTGAGISQDVLPTLFNAFQQGGRDIARQYGGLGLGLAITKALVELHRGSVRVESDGPGHGASFFVELPVIVRPETPAPAAPRRNVHSRPLRILLVEDHLDTTRAVSRLLSAIGHSVKSAPTVREALLLAGANDFDLILSDISLPDGTGLDFLRKLRESKSTPAIAVSGFGMEEDVMRSKEAGFASHVTKPITFDSLERAINEVVVAPTPASPAAASEPTDPDLARPGQPVGP